MVGINFILWSASVSTSGCFPPGSLANRKSHRHSHSSLGTPTPSNNFNTRATEVADIRIGHKRNTARGVHEFQCAHSSQVPVGSIRGIDRSELHCYNADVVAPFRADSPYFLLECHERRHASRR